MNDDLVSGTRHKARKKRDWKTVNAKRQKAVIGRSLDLSRYKVDQVTWISSRVSEEEWERLRTSGDSLETVRKNLRERLISELPKDQQVCLAYKSFKREIRKHWHCMVKAANEAASTFPNWKGHPAEFIGYMLEHEFGVKYEIFGGANLVSGTGHDVNEQENH